MKAVLIRTGSVPIQPLSNKATNLCRTNSLSAENPTNNAISLISVVNHDRNRSTLRRATSEMETTGGFRPFLATIAEDERFGPWPEIGIHGGGVGNGRGSGEKSGRGGDWFGNGSELSEHYEGLLKKNPGDSLVLRNYGKYLHEVVGDSARAEDLYGRAMLAARNDGADGELFSLYGRLIWETQRDEERARSYFDQAVSVSPDDCTVLGSYAHFMWEAEEDEDNSNTEISVPSLALEPAV